MTRMHCLTAGAGTGQGLRQAELAAEPNGCSSAVGMRANSARLYDWQTQPAPSRRTTDRHQSLRASFVARRAQTNVSNKFKSNGDNEPRRRRRLWQQSEKDDLRLAEAAERSVDCAELDLRNGSGHHDDDDDDDGILAKTARVVCPRKSHDEITGCNKSEASERRARSSAVSISGGSGERIGGITTGHSDKPGFDRNSSSPSWGPYANSRVRSQSLAGARSGGEPESGTRVLNQEQRRHQQVQVKDNVESRIGLETIKREAMTTGSFVSSETLNSRHQQTSIANPNSELQEPSEQQFSLQVQPQLAHPIGLGCSTSSSVPSLSSSSSSPSSEECQQEHNQQISDHFETVDLHSLGAKSQSNNMMNQAVERYTIISSSSVMSLSEGAAAQQYAQARHSGSSSNILNQTANGGGGGKYLIGKFVGKKAARFKELVLQNLGKADRTSDQLFNQYESNFHKQQQHVQQLIKEFKSYSSALKNYHEASKSLSKCIQQSTSCYQLARHDLACDNLSQLDQLNEDLMEKLQEKVIKSLGDYLDRFDDIKVKISKRHRKLIDYDSSRRLYELMYARVNKKRSASAIQSPHQGQQPHQSYQSILRGLKFLSQQQQQQQQSQASHHSNQESIIASQLVDEARLLKLREQFNYCKLMYETINGELHDELPVIYERKMKSVLEALQNYYDIKAHHHLNASKLISKTGEVMVIVKPDSDTDETDNNNNNNGTILSMYGNGEARADVNGSGSSGVSLSGSASNSSGSTMASPDCGDANRRQTTESNTCDNNEDDDDDFEQGEEQAVGERSEGNIVKTGLDGSVRLYVESQLKQQDGEEETSENQMDAGKVAANEDEVAGQTRVEREQLQEPEETVGANSVDEQDPKYEVMEVGQSQVAVEPGTATVSENNNEQAVHKLSDDLSEACGEGFDIDSERKGYLYRVRTNYKYLAEDVDELCFEPNEIIRVIEFDENHEPEDGWLLGIREVNNQRGLFPANFTQPI